MSQCFGRVPVGTKTDEEMRAFLQQKAEERGISCSELVRRLFDAYAKAEAGEASCPHCGRQLELQL